MKILGINAFGQNPSACLVVDGRMAGFSHEERFNRIKGSHGLFPAHTIKWLLTANKLTINDIDRIAFNWDCTKYPWHVTKELIAARIGAWRKGNWSGSNGTSSGMSEIIPYIQENLPSTVTRKIHNELRRTGHTGRIPKIEFVDHHLCHAYQAYYHGPYRDTLILVADGSGEENCVTGYRVVDGEFSTILKYKVPYSLGWFYGGMTAYLGFHPNRDEGKLMGLAAYGEAGKANNPWLELFDDILAIHSDGYDLNPYLFRIGSHEHHTAYCDALVDLIAAASSELRPIGVDDCDTIDGRSIRRYLRPEYIDLAYAVQTRLEGALISVVRKMMADTGLRTLCFSGGVAMNCKANRAVFDACGLDGMFIHPASSDDGSSIGAAFYLARQLDTLQRQPLTHACHGAVFNNDSIAAMLDNCGIVYTMPDDVCSVAGGMLNDGKCIGWFDGGAEMGARALGARSIVANPHANGMKDHLNAAVKYREHWRPYCPSILSNHQNRYLADPRDYPFMIMADNAAQLCCDVCPDVVHVDGTVRPQTVDAAVLPKWAHLIEEFGSVSGHPVVLNTSFNVRGEPIVNNPYDALRTFYSTGLDALVLGDYLIEKRS